MKRLILVCALALTACDTHVNSASTAETCQTAITVGSDLQDIAAFFIAHGWKVEEAQKVATAVHTFQLPITVACGLLTSQS